VDGWMDEEEEEEGKSFLLAGGEIRASWRRHAAVPVVCPLQHSFPPSWTFFSFLVATLNKLRKSNGIPSVKW
jgi:hypothetical protein